MGRRPPISTTKDTLFRCTTLFRCRLEGKYWDFKIDESINLEVGYGPILKPYQQPYPPIFSSILSPNSRSAFVAGERGWSIMSANFAQAACIKRSEEHTSELQSLMRISYAVFCLKKKNNYISQ